MVDEFFIISSFFFSYIGGNKTIIIIISLYSGADTEKKINLLKIFRFPDFIQCLPDFSLTKFFKVRKCERCGNLNQRLIFPNNIEINSVSTRTQVRDVRNWWSVTSTLIMVEHSNVTSSQLVKILSAYHKHSNWKKVCHVFFRVLFRFSAFSFSLNLISYTVNSP